MTEDTGPYYSAAAIAFVRKNPLDYAGDSHSNCFSWDDSRNWHRNWCYLADRYMDDHANDPSPTNPVPVNDLAVLKEGMKISLVTEPKEYTVGCDCSLAWAQNYVMYGDAKVYLIGLPDPEQEKVAALESALAEACLIFDVGDSAAIVGYLDNAGFEIVKKAE